MSSSFKIATQAAGVGALTALDALTTPVTPDPQFYYIPYRETVRLGNNTYRGLGSPAAEWSFPVLSLAQRNQLATFCTAASAMVYIATPNGGGTFKNYLAVMRLPDTEPPVKGGLINNYQIRFEFLVEQAP